MPAIIDRINSCHLHIQLLETRVVRNPDRLYLTDTIVAIVATIICARQYYGCKGEAE